MVPTRNFEAHGTSDPQNFDNFQSSYASYSLAHTLTHALTHTLTYTLNYTLTYESNQIYILFDKVDY